jgi:hypothetical protein
MASYALIGDSQGQGIFRLLSGQLSRLGHTVVFSRAEPGKDPGWWVKDKALPGQLQNAHADVVVFLVAGNNGDFDVARYTEKARTLIQLAKQSGAQTVFWLSPAYATDAATASRHERTAEMERSLIPALGAQWLDMRPYTRTGHRDGVHFTSSAYATWAEALAPQLTPTALTLGGGGRRWLGWGALAVGMVTVAWAVRRARA